MGKEEFCKVNE